MNTFLQFEHLHPALVALVAYMLFNAFVSGAPEPTSNSSIAYQWFYTSLHLLAVNLDKIWKQKGLPAPPEDAPKPPTPAAPAAFPPPPADKP